MLVRSIFLGLALLAAPAAAQDLVKIADVKRNILFFDMYRVAVFAPEPVAAPGRLYEQAEPLALELTCLYGGGMPDTLPKDWQRAILPRLSDQEEAALEKAFATLGKGDVVRIAFEPQSGTTIAVKGQTVVRQDGRRLLDGFLDLWLTDHPISNDLRKALRAG